MGWRRAWGKELESDVSKVRQHKNTIYMLVSLCWWVAFFAIFGFDIGWECEIILLLVWEKGWFGSGQVYIIVTIVHKPTSNNRELHDKGALLRQLHIFQSGHSTIHGWLAPVDILPSAAKAAIPQLRIDYSELKEIGVLPSWHFVYEGFIDFTTQGHNIAETNSSRWFRV